MLNSLQACRALAALLVVLYHTSHGLFRLEKYFGHKPFGPVFDFGFAGVDFFFVLSGFVMMHVHAQDIGQPRALSAYFWKRFTRIYPAYWVVLAVVLPVFILVPSFGKGYETDPDVIVRSIFLFPHPQGYPVVGVAWTLVYEVFFYLLFGVLILHRRIGTLLFLGWTACVLLQPYPWFGSYPWSFLFSPYYVRFLAGMGVALILKQWTLPLPRLTACAGAAMFLGAGLVDAYDGPLQAWQQTIGYTLGSAIALAGLVQAERSGSITPPGWLVYLGNASYAIYLVHQLALSLLAKSAKASQLDVYLPGNILFLLHVVGVVGVGCLFHHFVEHPLHAWTKCFFRRETWPALAFTSVSADMRKAA